MRVIKLSGSQRANVGRANATELRNSGMVPCVIYGGKEQIHFSAEEKSFKNIIYTPDVCQIDVEVNGKTYRTILQEAQYHRLTDKLIHADFLEVQEGKPVIMNIPVKTVGTSAGVRAGGKLTIKLRTLKVKGMASNLPDTIDINIEKLEIGKSIAVGEIVTDGIEILNPKNISVVSVNTTRAVAQAEQAAAKDDKKAPAKK
ncbi:MAG: ribosomal protein L25/ral stress protein Ctc [Bacteroidetes bacterium]|jgi:large subunit ribosomal protein L25|nr:ribosomal protein L25/ral stress protein Ctc [Bacteroidota bacterium]